MTTNRIARLGVLLMLASVASVRVAAQDSATVTVRRANVRREPSASSVVIATVERGTTLAVLSKSARWTRVRVSRSEGWIRDDLVRPITRNASDTVGAGPTRTDTPDAARASVLPEAQSSAPSDVDAKTTSVPGPQRSDSVWEHRVPSEARRYALLAPGGGHLYAGETLKGSVLLGGTFLVLYNGIGNVVGCGKGTVIVLYIKCSPVHTALMIGAYVFGIVDADNSAERMNRQRARLQTLGRLSVMPTMQFGPDNSRETVWTISWRMR